MRRSMGLEKSSEQDPVMDIWGSLPFIPRARRLGGISEGVEGEPEGDPLGRPQGTVDGKNSGCRSL